MQKKWNPPSPMKFTSKRKLCFRHRNSIRFVLVFFLHIERSGPKKKCKQFSDEDYYLPMYPPSGKRQKGRPFLFELIFLVAGDSESLHVRDIKGPVLFFWNCKSWKPLIWAQYRIFCGAPFLSCCFQSTLLVRLEPLGKRGDLNPSSRQSSFLETINEISFSLSMFIKQILVNIFIDR